MNIHNDPTKHFVVKDSGVREEYASGMRRDTQEGKPDYELIDLDFLTRFAEHLTKGAKKYGEDNWRLANSKAEWRRFRKSAFRHLMKWLKGEKDEDHGSAVVFNIMAADYVEAKISREENLTKSDHDDGYDVCTVLWDTAVWQVMTYKELYSLRDDITDHIQYFVDGALTFHTLPSKEPPRIVSSSGYHNG